MRRVDRHRRRAAARWTRAVWRSGKALARACASWGPRAQRFIDELLRAGDRAADRLEHALAKFSADDEGYRPVRIARVLDAPRHRWVWHDV